jgi:glycine/D-amino acid oxidase-like deaminating enzyme
MPEYTVAGSGDAAARVRGPIHAQRHVRVICIGAGASGLLMAYKLQRHFSNYSLTVYEKNPEISGTWYENKYPGYVYFRSSWREYPELLVNYVLKERHACRSQ